MSEIPTFEQKTESKNQIIWNIYDKEKAQEKAQIFEQACDQKNEDNILENLRDPKFLRTSIINRGEQNKNFFLLYNAFNQLLQNQFGPDENILTLTSEQIIETIHQAEIPEQILAELSDIAYHTEDGQLLYRTLGIIDECEEAGVIINPEVALKGHHNEATWLASRIHGQSTLAVQINEEVSLQAEKHNTERLRLKSAFGIAYNKPNLTPIQRIHDFQEISQGMKKIDLEYDALRANIESTFWRYYYTIQKDTPKNLQKEHLDQAHEDALESLKKSLDLNYKVAEILSRELLSDIYKQEDTKGSRKKARNYFRKSGQLRKEFNYNIKRNIF